MPIGITRTMHGTLRFGEHGAKLDPSKALTYILAGKAAFTLIWGEELISYYVELKKGSTDFWFVNTVRDPNEPTEKCYMGVIFGQNFRTTPKSRYNSDSPQVHLFESLLYDLQDGNPLPEGVELWHAGRCGRCGKVLTIPENISIGLGPECQKYQRRAYGA